MKKQDITNLAKEIRRLWCQERQDFDMRTTGYMSSWGKYHIPKWDGGEDANGKHYKPIWEAIAAMCISSNLDPRILIKATFYNKSIVPTPNHAVGPAALTRYNEYNNSSTALEQRHKILHSFESQKSLAAALVISKKQYANLDDTTAWRIIVASKDESFSPLFRYCIAKNQDWIDLADDLEQAAKWQYSRHAALYDDVWKEWIPEDLKASYLTNV